VRTHCYAQHQIRPEKAVTQNVLVKTYKGNENAAAKEFQADAAVLASEGYYPTSQNYAPGSYGCGSFIVALLLCFVFIGIIVFVYMLFVKPPGVLSVTYELRAPSPAPGPAEAEKVCPRCAERVKAAAKICRFCNFEFG
jgi:hypothetical protein